MSNSRYQNAHSIMTAAAPHSQAEFSLYTSLAVFLLGAIALVVHSGYSVGSALLLSGGLYCLLAGKRGKLGRDDYVVLGVLVLYGTIGMLEIVLHQADSRYFDKPLRFILAAVAFILVRRYPPHPSWLWGGLAAGGILTASWAGFQKLALGIDRAGGFTYVIQFGNISMLTGLFCLAGLGWAYSQPHRARWLTLLWLGAVGGVLGSLLSGSRGGWVGLPLLLLVLYRAYSDFFSTRLKWAAAVSVIIGAGTVYSVPQLGVQDRLHAAVNDIKLYQAGDAATSLGARFEMWKGASLLFVQKPMLGWGTEAYQAGMENLVTRRVIDEAVVGYGHAHNEILDAAAKRGVAGVIALLALYLVPLYMFGRGLRSPDLSHRSIAIAGVLLPVAYIDFGLSQVLFAHNSGVMIYAVWLVVLWGCYRSSEARREPCGSPHLPKVDIRDGIPSTSAL